MNKLKQILVQLFTTKIGLVIVTMLSAFIFGVISNECNAFWAEVMMYLSLIYPLALLIVLLIYALIINPIKNR